MVIPFSDWPNPVGPSDAFKLSLIFAGCKRRRPIAPGCSGMKSKSYYKSMKIGERGQVTIPQDIREQFRLGPDTEVEFRVVNGSIVLKKTPRKLNLAKWKGRCGDSFAKLGYSSVDKFIEDVRGR